MSREKIDFDSPPLDEVVVGVQFAPPPRYLSINDRGVFALFEDELPIVQEQPRLEPQFEVFGGPPQNNFNIEFGNPVRHNRLWLIAKDDSHLVQFQDDRFMLNWRRRSNGAPYPRHEGMANFFRSYLARLADHFASELSYNLRITQAELSYINVIPLSGDAVERWTNLICLPAAAEGLSFHTGEVLYNDGDPVGRLYTEMQIGSRTDNPSSKALLLNLTFRGRPVHSSIESALDFLAFGRELIVNRFCAITTSYAHEQWGMKT